MFGSYARNEQSPASDVDLLLDLRVNEKYSDIDYVFELFNTIESIINIHVDFVTARSLLKNPSPKFINNIEKEMVWFYEV